jgi:hypothetical protein
MAREGWTEIYSLTPSGAGHFYFGPVKRRTTHMLNDLKVEVANRGKRGKKRRRK